MPPGGMRFGLGNARAGLALVAAMGAEASRRRLLASATLFVSELQAMLSQPGKGALRRQPKKVRQQLRSKSAKVRARASAYAATNRASRVGDPPAPDTQTLLRSAGMDVMAGGMRIRVGVAAKYGVFLEFEKHRPFMRPTWARVAKQLRAVGLNASLRVNRNGAG